MKKFFSMWKNTEKSVLNENVINSVLPEDILSDIEKGNTSWKMHFAHPDFIIPLLSKRLEHISKKLTEFGVNNTPSKNELSALISKCRNFESPIINQLEKICMNILINVFNIPEDKVITELKLVDKVDFTNHTINFSPKSEKYKFSDLVEVGDLYDEIYKRRLLNILSVGFAMNSAYKIISVLNTYDDTITDDMIHTYKLFLLMNEYLILTNKVDINIEEPHQIGISEVILGQGEEKVNIIAQGIIFPSLLCESLKAFMELFASHGLPKDTKKAMMVINRADYVKADAWDMRLGPSLWNIVEKHVPNMKTLPYMYVQLANVNPYTFSDYLFEVFCDTKKGDRFMKEIENRATCEMEYGKFVKKMETLNTKQNLLTDEFIRPEEL